jgi:hypothetical protein
MLTDIDRLLIATPDAEGAARAWADSVAAEEVGRDRLRSLGATRLTVRAGTSDIELIQPDGTGLIADELKRRGRAHLFAAGAMSETPDAVAKTAAASGAEIVEAEGRYGVTLTIEGAPIRFVVSHPAERERAGLLDFVYEATVLAQHQAQAVDQIARCFGLDTTSFTEITSEKFGYTGILTLFEAGRLHRFEVITPLDMEKTMGRYYRREGAGFYMAFAESAAMPAMERVVAPTGLTIDRPKARPPEKSSDQLWLHPATMGGMMLGVSRPTMAWFWSGQPQNVENIDV